MTPTDWPCSAASPWPSASSERGAAYRQGQRGRPPSQGRHGGLRDPYCRPRGKLCRRGLAAQQGRRAGLRRRAQCGRSRRGRAVLHRLRHRGADRARHLVDPAIGTYESRHPESRSGRPAMTSSTRGSTSWQMASPTPTRKGCLARGVPPRGDREGHARSRGGGRRHALCRAARRGHRRRRQLPHGKGRRTAHRRGDRARAPPPGCPNRAALGPARQRRSRRLRHRRHHHAAGVQVSAERPTSGASICSIPAPFW